MRALRSAARLGLAALLTTGLITSATTTSGVAAPAAPFPDTFDLPAGFQPEGIAIGPGPTAWFGSRVDGDIYQVDLPSGTGTVVSEGPGVGSPSVGHAPRRMLETLSCLAAACGVIGLSTLYPD